MNKHLNTNAVLGEKTQAGENKERGREVGKNGEQLYNSVVLLTTDGQAQCVKAVSSADTCAQSSKTARTSAACLKTVREKEERMYLLDPSCSSFHHLFKVHPTGINSPTHLGCVIWPLLGIFWESQIPCPVALCLEMLVSLRGQKQENPNESGCCRNSQSKTSG